jgi:hypothetical protein
MTTTIETRTAAILNALETLRPYVGTLTENKFLFPEFARFFATVYTAEDKVMEAPHA